MPSAPPSLPPAFARRRALVRKNLEIRAAVTAAVRGFFTDSGYLEVETPVRIPAPLPETHISAPPAGEWFFVPNERR